MSTPYWDMLEFFQESDDPSKPFEPKRPTDPDHSGASPWNTMWMGGQNVVVPGIVHVRGAVDTRPQAVKPPKSEGTVLYYRGRGRVELRITVTIWTPDHLDQWEELLRSVILPASKALAQANRKPTEGVPVYHPALALMGVRSIFFTQVGVPEPSHRIRGAVDIELHAVESAAVKTTEKKSKVDPGDLSLTQLDKTKIEKRDQATRAAEIEKKAPSTKDVDP